MNAPYSPGKGLVVLLPDENWNPAKVALKPNSDELNLVAQPVGVAGRLVHACLDRHAL